MEGADSASLTIYLTGKAQEEWSEFHGDYKLIEDKDKDKPVYRNIKGKHLYCQKDGTWAVSFIKGETHPVLKSSPAAASPLLLSCSNAGASWSSRWLSTATSSDR